MSVKRGRSLRPRTPEPRRPHLSTRAGSSFYATSSRSTRASGEHVFVASRPPPDREAPPRAPLPLAGHAWEAGGGRSGASGLQATPSADGVPGLVLLQAGENRERNARRAARSAANSLGNPGAWGRGWIPGAPPGSTVAGRRLRPRRQSVRPPFGREREFMARRLGGRGERRRLLPVVAGRR
jgi:hypothetical protein